MKKRTRTKIGDRFGRLIIIKKLDNDNIKRGRKVLCKCDCGNLKETYTSYLIKQTCRSCGCLDIESHFKGFGSITGTFFSDLKHNAKNRSLEFDLDLEFLDTLLKKQKYLCQISGLPIKIAPRRQSQDTTASVDRIDSNKGYIKTNVQFVHKHINMMKSNHTSEYFLNLCKIISEYNNGKKKKQ